MNKSKIIYSKSNQRILQIAAFIAVVLVFARENPFELKPILILTTLIILILLFYKSQQLRVTGTNLKFGEKKLYSSKLKSAKTLPLKDFIKTEVRKNADNFFEILISGKGNQVISICTLPNENPAKEKADYFEKEIKRLAGQVN